MKHIKIILGLILFASVSTFAQSPRIKLNQITKDSLSGSVLISSPTDSGMVYSRELFISYGADTVLILNGDTLAVTSGIISSVLSDGVTVLGNGTSGNELKVDTSIIATIKALSDSLAGIISSVTTDLTLTGDGTVGTPLKVDTAVIATLKALADSVATRGTVTSVSAGTQISGMGMTISNGTTTPSIATSITNAANFRTAIGAGTGNGTVTSVSGTGTVNGISLSGTVTSSGNLTLGGTLSNVNLASQVTGTLPVANGGTGVSSLTANKVLVGNGTSAVLTPTNLHWDNTNSRLGIGTSSPSEKLEVNGSIVGINGFFGEDDGSFIANGANPSIVQKLQRTQGGFAFAFFKGFATNTTTSLTSKLYDLGATGLLQSGATAPTTNYVYFSLGPNAAYNNGWLYLINNANKVVEIPGRLGIGTSSPAEKLHVVGNIVATGSITPSYSDYNLKTNISDLTDGLDVILDLKPKTFNFISDNDLGLENDLIVGLVAQDVEQSLSSKPYLNSIIKQIGKYKAIDVHKIIPITVKAIQEQQEIIETQASEIDQLKTLIQSLTNRIENLENN